MSRILLTFLICSFALTSIGQMIDSIYTNTYYYRNGAKGDLKYQDIEYFNFLNKRVVKEEYGRLGGMLKVTLYKRDSLGRLLEDAHYGRDSLLDYYREFSYDLIGRKTQMNHLDKDGNTVKVIDYEYNKEGLVSMELEYSGKDKKFRYERLFFYDKKGRVIRQEEIDKWNENSKLHYYKGKRIEERKWNKHNDLIELIRSREDNTVYEHKSFTYPKYDKHKNWIEQRSVVDGKNYEIRERIIYYTPK